VGLNNDQWHVSCLTAREDTQKLHDFLKDVFKEENLILLFKLFIGILCFKSVRIRSTWCTEKTDGRSRKKHGS
jgi:hypothetical protein